MRRGFFDRFNRFGDHDRFDYDRYGMADQPCHGPDLPTAKATSIVRTCVVDSSIATTVSATTIGLTMTVMIWPTNIPTVLVVSTARATSIIRTCVVDSLIASTVSATTIGSTMTVMV